MQTVISPDVIENSVFNPFYCDIASKWAMRYQYHHWIPHILSQNLWSMLNFNDKLNVTHQNWLFPRKRSSTEFHYEWIKIHEKQSQILLKCWWKQQKNWIAFIPFALTINANDIEIKLFCGHSMILYSKSFT